uniref:NADH dehydrogenase subunit 2 n=1 Tax=Enterobius vermicularis TaxID=51028 RepID=A0A1E1GIL7_ENTVE|nr:NADH dehydrogenase subunit 2 [Enterobius vermicularis]BAV82705.1 NADH dehydrogenase subunit 2 [Enterobius vermicularis]
MLVVYFFCVMLMFFMSFMVVNYIVWWGLFLVMDLFFVFLCKLEGCSYSSVINYFIFQEFLGLVFLIVSGWGVIQGVVVMCKMGLLPFHYWLLTVIDGLSGWVLFWFLTGQKLPYMGILVVLASYVFIVLVFLGFVMVYLQFFVIKDYFMILVLSSTESFNWFFLGVLMNLFSGLVLFLFYFLAGLLLLPFWSGVSKVNYGWLTTLIYINIPLGVSFLVKMFVLGLAVNYLFLFLLFVMVLMYMSFMSIFSWFMLMSFEVVLEEVKVDGFIFMIFALIFLLLIYYFFFCFVCAIE